MDFLKRWDNWLAENQTVEDTIMFLEEQVANFRQSLVEIRGRQIYLEKMDNPTGIDVQAEIKDWENLKKETEATLKSLSERLDYLKRNKLMLEGTDFIKNVEDFLKDDSAFSPSLQSVDLSNKSGNPFSQMQKTHDEMIKRMDWSSAVADAKYDLAVGQAKTELESGKDEEAEKELKAKAQIDQMKLQMGLADETEE